jgi:hypothetical protein
MARRRAHEQARLFVRDAVECQASDPLKSMPIAYLGVSLATRLQPVFGLPRVRWRAPKPGLGEVGEDPPGTRHRWPQLGWKPLLACWRQATTMRIQIGGHWPTFGDLSDLGEYFDDLACVRWTRRASSVSTTSLTR